MLTQSNFEGMKQNDVFFFNFWPTFLPSFFLVIMQAHLVNLKFAMFDVPGSLRI